MPAMNRRTEDGAEDAGRCDDLLRAELLERLAARPAIAGIPRLRARLLADRCPQNLRGLAAQLAVCEWAPDPVGFERTFQARDGTKASVDIVACGGRWWIETKATALFGLRSGAWASLLAQASRLISVAAEHRVGSSRPRVLVVFTCACEPAVAAALVRLGCAVVQGEPAALPPATAVARALRLPLPSQPQCAVLDLSTLLALVSDSTHLSSSSPLLRSWAKGNGHWTQLLEQERAQPLLPRLQAALATHTCWLALAAHATRLEQLLREAGGTSEWERWRRLRARLAIVEDRCASPQQLQKAALGTAAAETIPRPETVLHYPPQTLLPHPPTPKPSPRRQPRLLLHIRESKADVRRGDGSQPALALRIDGLDDATASPSPPASPMPLARTPPPDPPCELLPLPAGWRPLVGLALRSDAVLFTANGRLARGLPPTLRVATFVHPARWLAGAAIDALCTTPPRGNGERVDATPQPPSTAGLCYCHRRIELTPLPLHPALQAEPCVPDASESPAASGAIATPVSLVASAGTATLTACAASSAATLTASAASADHDDSAVSASATSGEASTRFAGASTAIAASTTPYASIASLPVELLGEVLEAVAAHRLRDALRAASTCRSLAAALRFVRTVKLHLPGGPPGCARRAASALRYWAKSREVAAGGRASVASACAFSQLERQTEVETLWVRGALSDELLLNMCRRARRHSPRLASVRVLNRGGRVGPDGAEAVARLLSRHVERKGDSRRCSSGADCGGCSPTTPQSASLLREFVLVDASVGVNGAAAIRAVLRCSRRLEALRLERCGLLKADVRLLASALPHDGRRLRVLALPSNRIGTEGALRIAKWLDVSENGCATLDLSSCAIASPGAVAVAVCLVVARDRQPVRAAAADAALRAGLGAARSVEAVVGSMGQAAGSSRPCGRTMAALLLANNGLGDVAAAALAALVAVGEAAPVRVDVGRNAFTQRGLQALVDGVDVALRASAQCRLAELRVWPTCELSACHSIEEVPADAFPVPPETVRSVFKAQTALMLATGRLASAAAQ